MDFFIPVKVEQKVNGRTYNCIVPKYATYNAKDIMIKGHTFYAYWNEETQCWDTNSAHLMEFIDRTMYEYKLSLDDGDTYVVHTLHDSNYKEYWKYRQLVNSMEDYYVELDQKIVFKSDKVTREDYSSKRLSYDLVDGPIPAFEELMGILYEPSELKKIMWAIGSILTGKAKDIDKFYVLYGYGGTGKGTILKILRWIFEEYCGYFNAKSLCSNSDGGRFSLIPFTQGKLISIDEDGDLSRIGDNTRLNSVVSHEDMMVEEKGKNAYSFHMNTTLFVGSNSPVKITDSKSGIIRRLIDVNTTGVTVEKRRYDELMKRIQYEEIPYIAYQCVEVFKECGPTYYNNYKPIAMIAKTNDIYNFVEEMSTIWDESVSLSKAWEDYKNYVSDAKVQYPLIKREFKEELKSYFDDFKEHTKSSSNVYSGLNLDKIGSKKIQSVEEEVDDWLELGENESDFDKVCKDCKAQYTKNDGSPKRRWERCTSRLREIDTNVLHYVKPMERLIMIDFDLKDENGEKSLKENLCAAREFPPTYAEVSKGGGGLHLYYFYDGDIEELSNMYDKDIEIKTYSKKKLSAIRRKLTLCNTLPIATILSSFLPKKEVSNVVNNRNLEDEKHLKNIIKKSLRKENCGHTAPEIDFIKKITDDAYNEGLVYDISDLKQKLVTFAAMSTNQSERCLAVVDKIKLKSKNYEDSEVLAYEEEDERVPKDAPFVFFDIEQFPNLLLICWKFKGEPKQNIKRMYNPTPEEVKSLFKYNLIGFNNRRYDNHIIYARAQGYSIKECYKVSYSIINNHSGFFSGAYQLSYTDIYDYCSNMNKQSLKKWEIQLGIYHLENQYAWDEDLPEDKWEEVGDYCCNDVWATEKTFEATEEDYEARLILSDLSGLSPNDSSNSHTQHIVFGNERHPQSHFNYPDLSKEFPGYKFDNGVSTYMGETVGEGGWVFANLGMYRYSKCFDVSGMHPASIYAMKLFGEEYTERYYDLVRVRTHIKHKDYDAARDMFDGKLRKHLADPTKAKKLSNALKTPINAVYGQTAAHYENPFRDPRNIDNVVAKRGALFMIQLKHKVENMGYTVIHCKTDSIKIENPDEKIEQFIYDEGKRYGYTFEVEDIFERVCLVNGSTFVGKLIDGEWMCKAAQYQHPFVNKTLFSNEKTDFNDFKEVKSVKKGRMYLDFEDGNEMKFVGTVGCFTPVKEGGAKLYVTQDGSKFDAVSGTKGYRWMESDVADACGGVDIVDMDYYRNLVDDAIENIEKHGNFDVFVKAPVEEYDEYIIKEIAPKRAA